MSDCFDSPFFWTDFSRTIMIETYLLYTLACLIWVLSHFVCKGKSKESSRGFDHLDESSWLPNGQAMCFFLPCDTNTFLIWVLHQLGSSIVDFGKVFLMYRSRFTMAAGVMPGIRLAAAIWKKSITGLRQANLVVIAYASSEGSG